MGKRRRRREGLRLRLGAEDRFQRGRMQPGWRDDVGASLAFQQEGEPEGKGGAVGGLEGGGWALR